MDILKSKDTYLAINHLSKKAIRIRAGKNSDFKERNPSVRYAIYDMSEIGEKERSIKVDLQEDSLLINDLISRIRVGNKGFEFSVESKEDERFYGLGDADRSTLEKRGTEHMIWVQNVKCYIPFPMLLSSKGWGIFSTTTFKQKFDVCKSQKDRLRIISPKGYCDIVIFFGKDFTELLAEFKRISGFSKMLPRFAYGFSFVANQKIDAFNMINEMYTFRKEEIPCDVYGLEPEWMEKRYDSSVNKKFNPNKFYIPYWMDTDTVRRLTFFKPIRDMNFKLSLWLCCDYDLSYEEERNARIPLEEDLDLLTHEDDSYLEDRFEIDDNLSNPRYLDNLTKKDEPWFEHLKKFVDMGARAFKLDGAWQIEEHPDRRYGNGMIDDEMHNLYPLIYAKQMSDGFENHTNKRSLVYSAGGFAGIQQYVATWAGDTGGGPKPLVSMLNLAMSGHSNTTCDMSIYDIEGIHFGFLQPWSQQANWDYWNQPWLFEKKLKDAFIYYSQLRYSLIPYIYNSAYRAYLNLAPTMRPLVYDYPEDEKTFNILNQYMLGEFLMVAAFIDKEIYLPKGTWIDYFTKEEYEGKRYLKYEVPEGRGGALFIKKGAILTRSFGIFSIKDEPFDKYTLEIYPSKEKTSTKIYEDDGISLEYKQGKYSVTEIDAIKVGNKIDISISSRKGDFEGKKENIEYEVRIMKMDKNDYVHINGKAFNLDELTDQEGIVKVCEKEILND